MALSYVCCLFFVWSRWLILFEKAFLGVVMNSGIGIFFYSVQFLLYSNTLFRSLNKFDSFDVGFRIPLKMGSMQIPHHMM